jgi:predicted transglutaminase-like cysteine proteinase
MLKVFQSRAVAVSRTSLIAVSTILVSVLTIAASASDGASARPKLRSTLPGESGTLVASASEISSGASYSSPASYELLASPPPARYFTINEVLAKRNGGNAASSSTRLAAVDPATTATDAAPVAAPAPVRSDEPFGYATFRAPDGLLWSKWRKVQAEITAELVILNKCRSQPDDCASPAAKRFLALLAKMRQHEGRARVEVVNRAVNSEIIYTSDFAQHGVPDLWSAPLATYATGRGDCEDYAIAKYVALRETGTPAENLRLLLVRDNAVRMDHAVLGVRQDGHWLILDNRRAALLEHNDTRYFTPLFALDQTGVKFFAAPYAKRPARAGEADAVPAAWLDDDTEFSLRGSISISAPAPGSGLSSVPLLI